MSPRRCSAVSFVADELCSAASEVLGTTLPYDDILALRDRMWEISPTLVRYDVTERTSVDTALVGVKQLIAKTAGAKAVFAPLKKPIENFYQTDPISRACVSFSFLFRFPPCGSVARHLCMMFQYVRGMLTHPQVRHDGAVHAGVRIE